MLKFLLLPTTEKLLLMEAVFLLITMELGKRILPFRALRRLLPQAADEYAQLSRASYTPPERIAWAVQAASRWTPGARSCLTQALAAQVLLTRRNHTARLHIGVARGERDRFQAHAWVESGGKVLIGESGLERYTPLAVLEGTGPVGAQDRKLAPRRPGTSRMGQYEYAEWPMR